MACMYRAPGSRTSSEDAAGMVDDVEEMPGEGSGTVGPTRKGTVQ